MNPDACDLSVLQNLLEPLTTALLQNSALRIVARPHAVVADIAEGSLPCQMAWDEQTHQEALALLAYPTSLAPNLAVARLGDTIVVEGWPGPLPRVAQLVERQELSLLCARTLGAALATGRNILFTGPFDACLPLMAALVDEGRRPVMLAGDAWQAVPARWHVATHMAQGQRLGADRMAAWGLPPKAVGRLMAAHCGVVAHLDGHRLERALMRYEAAWSRPGQGTLGVVAGIDLVVVVRRGDPGVHVAQVAELILTQEGYRPVQLFTRGRAPMPTALALCTAPSFVGEFATIGHAVLAEELGVTDLDTSASAEHAATDPVQSDTDVERRPVQKSFYAHHLRSTLGAQKTPAKTRSQQQLQSAPGWELDRASQQLADGSEGQEEAGSAPLSEESATLAAAFGLAPPPRPTTRRVVEVDTPAASGFAGAMADELRRK